MFETGSGIDMASSPDTLYHYSQFNPDRLKHIVRDSKIYCSNPSTFNDPWDCKPHFYIPDESDVEYCKRCVEWFCASWQMHYGKMPEELVHRAELMRTDRKAFEWVMSELSEHFGRRVASAYRVFCLSATPTSTLLWSHYSKHHTGIALEFNRRNTIFAGAIGIQYVESYPKFDVTQDAPSDDLPILFKSSVWSYEQEYRLIALEKSETSYVLDSRRCRNGLLFIHSGALTSIILGCHFPDSQIPIIRSIAQERIPAINLKRARRVSNNYNLTIEPLWC